MCDLYSILNSKTDCMHFKPDTLFEKLQEYKKIVNILKSYLMTFGKNKAILNK